jgi:RHS repeat-associated protein
MPSVFKTHTTRIEPCFYSSQSTLTPRRSAESVCTSYVFGFNGQEMDNEITGQTGTHTTAMFWEYDSRLGRRWNVDPIVKEYESPYMCFSGNPIWFSDPAGDNAGLPDNYVIHEDGTTTKEETADKTDHFEYQDNEGNVTDLGTYDKTDNGMIHVDKDGSTYMLKKGFSGEQSYIKPEAWAQILGASKEYMDETGLKVQFTQFNTIDSKHSGSLNQGDMADIRYSNVKGDVNEPVLTGGSNYDRAKSQILVDKLIKFGYNNVPGGAGRKITFNNKTKYLYSVITQRTGTTHAEFTNTHYVDNHYHHIHVGWLDYSHIKPKLTIERSEPKPGQQGAQ